jgi:hypothetical protein
MDMRDVWCIGNNNKGLMKSRVHGDRRICTVVEYTLGDSWGKVLCSQEMGVNRKKRGCNTER